jgi:beta-lactamase class A
MNFDRRRTLALAASALAAPALVGRARAQGGGHVQAAIDRFAKLPATASGLVIADHPTAPWRAASDPDTRLFVGSAVKTFMLAQFLRDVEAGRLSEDKQMAVDDAVRSPSSPVFLNLSGTTTARSVLEAMIAHSDNTATDITLAAVGPAQVRALIAQAGLSQTQIPDSTRRMISYFAGAPEGVDLGWEGAMRAAKDGPAATPRSPMNDKQAMISTAAEMVRWYQQALRGTFFTTPETLVEFKRIQSMADAIARVVPSDTVAFAKGGSIDWLDFHCVAFAGQMIVARVPITFGLTLNWRGPNDGVPTMMQSYSAAVADVLGEAARVAA